MHGPPRPIPSSGPKKSDVVIFTDGSAPISIPKDPSSEMIGGVMFTREDLPKCGARSTSIVCRRTRTLLRMAASATSGSNLRRVVVFLAMLLHYHDFRHA